MVTGDPGHAYPQGWNRTGDFSSRVSMYGNLFVVIPARIELATYRLGVDPIRHREVASNA